MSLTASATFPRAFGSKPAGTAAPVAGKQDQPKAQYWLNVGYPVTLDTDGGPEDRFVSLPLGIPLDTQEHFATNSRNELFAQFQGARNDLLDQIMEVAKTLEPGQDRILNLSIQLRRVNDEAPAPTNENNVFVRKLEL